MNDVTKTLETLLAWSELHPDSGVRLSDGRVANGKDIQAVVFSLQDKIANQTRWLVESRQRENEALDALKDMTESRAEWEQIANEYKAKLTTPTPPRRLREYKGVTYDNGAWAVDGTCYYSAAAAINYEKGLTDADHAALLALRDEPYLPVETLEEVVGRTFVAPKTAVNKLCADIRTWLAQQPQGVPEANCGNVTPEQAVKVLPSSCYPLIQKALDETIQGVTSKYVGWQGTRRICSDLVEQINAELAKVTP